MPRLRRSSWALVIWTAVVLFWTASYVFGGIGECTPESGNDRFVCEVGRAIGITYGFTAIVVIGIVGYVLLGAIWFLSRPRTSG